MEFIKWIIKKSVVFMFLSLLANVNAQEFKLHGEWKYVKYYSWKVTKFNRRDMNLIKNSILHFDENKVYFEGGAAKLIPSCNYNKMVVKKFFDREEEEPSFIEDRYLAVAYTKEQLSKIARIELSCKNNCMEIIYLKQDTLILNYCGGMSIYLVKSRVN